MIEKLSAAIRAALDELEPSVEKMREFRQLRDNRFQIIEECLKERPELAQIAGTIPPSYFEDAGPLGQYYRARFYRLYQIIRAPKIQLVASAGSGKTRGTSENLRKWDGRVIWFTVPSRKMIRQVAETFRNAGYHGVYEVYGRNGLCLRKDPDLISQQICAVGLDVQKTICGNPDDDDSPLCPHFGACPYQRQRETLSELKAPGDEPLILVMASAYLVAWPNFLPEPDLLVVDEKHWDLFVQQASIGLATLKQLLQSDFQFKHRKTDAETILSAICEGIASNDGLITILRQRGSTDPKALEPLALSIESEIEHLTEDLRPDVSDAEIKRILDSPRLQDLGVARSAIDALRRELQIRGRAGDHARSLSYPNVAAFGSNSDRVGIHFRRKSPAVGLAVLILDATAEDMVNKVIWGKDLRTIVVEADRNAVILQVSGKSFSRRSILGKQSGKPFHPEEAKKLRAQIEGFVLGRASLHKKLLVVAQKQVEEQWLRPWLQSLPENVAGHMCLAHFGALRGSNEYEKCDATVIIGRELPSPNAVTAQARALFFDSPQPLSMRPQFDRLYTNRTLVGGAEERDRIYRHIDPIVEALREQICERELEQAFDRLRLIHNLYPKFVYLLTNHTTRAEVWASAPLSHFLNPPNTPVGQAVGLAAERCAGLPAVALPIGYRVLSKLFPSIWKSDVQARHSILDDSYGRPEMVPLFQMILLFGNGVPFIVEYRTPGQRGVSSTAIVYFPQNWDPRHTSLIGDAASVEMISQIALEKVVGPVATLKIESVPGIRYSLTSTPLWKEVKS